MIRKHRVFKIALVMGLMLTFGCVFASWTYVEERMETHQSAINQIDINEFYYSPAEVIPSNLGKGKDLVECVNQVLNNKYGLNGANKNTILNIVKNPGDTLQSDDIVYLLYTWRTAMGNSNITNSYFVLERVSANQMNIYVMDGDKVSLTQLNQSVTVYKAEAELDSNGLWVTPRCYEGTAKVSNLLKQTVDISTWTRVE